jgi:glycosyltransferase involved in cell wall biosynthesis
VRVLFLNPFHGGSHRAFAEGWSRRSRHDFTLVTMPARFWKWRMRGAALHFARKVGDPAAFDALVVTDLMSLSDLKALWGAACPPALAYFHENQLSYPLPPGEAMDYQFGFTDVTTGLAAARVLFNSRFQHDAFFAGLPAFIRMMPEYNPVWVMDAIRARAGVLHPGCEFPAGPPELREPAAGGASPGAAGPSADAVAPPLVVWNHRWEFDKDPPAFFAALDAVLARGVEFRLALLGENFQVVPKEFIAARERFGSRVVQYGFVESREGYLDWLRQGRVVVSTAIQENFGMSIVEAIRMGCHPLLPDRLSYPEILPREFHAGCLYSGPHDLADRLAALLAPRSSAGRADSGAAGTDLRRRLADAMGSYSWDAVVGSFDAEIDAIARARNGQSGSSS